MKDRNYRPRMAVKMRLTLAWQNKLLMLISEHFGIMESFTEDQILIVPPDRFLKFFFAANSGGKSLTLKQIHAEYIDAKKEPRITVVRNWPGDTVSNYTEGNTEGEPFATLVQGHVQRRFMETE